MEIIFILSGENETLPKAEVTASLETENVSFNIKYHQNGILIIEIADEDSAVIEVIGKKVAYTHEICKLLFKTSIPHLNDDIQKYPWKDIISQDYAVRVKRVGIDPDFNSQAMEIELGGIIKKELGDEAIVNLENPDTFLRTIVLDNSAPEHKTFGTCENIKFSRLRSCAPQTSKAKLSNVLVSEQLIKRSKKHYNDLKPHKRPFFYPGSMSPKLARGMVNLARAKKGSTVLDPFCGTGGILIEAGIVGARVIGTDIDEKMVEGTKKNLEYCNIKDYTIFQGDARYITLEEKVDAIVTDPPYGISASTAGIDSKKIYEESLASMQGLLKEDGYICMATPHYLDIHELVSHTKFKIIEQYKIRMHKSLTRVISVLTKK
ncbi:MULTISPECIES: DNA methyltransferase [Methanobacterium]|uniref:tRNA (guanine(10)-N(2))-dimethyltransferase n=1 Tax=Methanobacterium bryantii TaxID=2161 RepID=A0A2A2H9B4_METBR|nr:MULTISPECIES: DNA methyltransferase [Methanobacterium]OEC86947.1 tRNA (guanine-N2)-dimethyltransferase [Methanobacterium sp. A39]PAV06009.1 tRNA (guanine-N2)-dimethyltransferase [Methanobacterium bryantii]